MIPIRDLNPTKRTPYITYMLIAVNILVFLWQNSLPKSELQRVFYDHAVVPLFWTREPFSLETFLDTVRSMFMHGGWLHLGSNMLYLWIFGDNVEDRLGAPLYVLVYFVCGFAATVCQVVINTESFVPMVGASGAIAGVLGAYIIMFPRARIVCLVFFGFIFFTPISAWLVLGFWFVSQLFSGVASIGATTSGGGVAFFAHIGGFVAGAMIAGAYNAIFPAPYEEIVEENPEPYIIMPPTPQQQNLLALLEQKAQMYQAVALYTRKDGTVFGFVVGISPAEVMIKDYRGYTLRVPLSEILRAQ